MTGKTILTLATIIAGLSLASALSANETGKILSVVDVMEQASTKLFWSRISGGRSN